MFATLTNEARSQANNVVVIQASVTGHTSPSAVCSSTWDVFVKALMNAFAAPSA